jgi:hypothetical protein
VSEKQAISWKTKYSSALRELQEVCGVGVTKTGKGDFVIAVLLKTESTAAIEQRITAILKDIPFRTVATGPFELLPAQS